MQSVLISLLKPPRNALPISNPLPSLEPTLFSKTIAFPRAFFGHHAYNLSQQQHYRSTQSVFLPRLAPNAHLSFQVSSSTNRASLPAQKQQSHSHCRTLRTASLRDNGIDILVLPLLRHRIMGGLCVAAQSLRRTLKGTAKQTMKGEVALRVEGCRTYSS